MSLIKTGFFCLCLFTTLLYIGSLFDYKNIYSDITNIPDLSDASSISKKKFINALNNNNINYFRSITEDSSELNNSILIPFLHKIEIQVNEKDDFLFFSFLGVKKNSSILHKHYEE
jgi:hypothetical protein